VFTAVPVIFKGSGFYVTDNRAKNPAGTTRGGDGHGSDSKTTSEAPSGNGDKAKTIPSSAGKKEEKPVSGKDK
jgi:predicted nucleic acid-binding Zn ribbon protein